VSVSVCVSASVSRPGRSYEGNIKLHFREVDSEFVDWTGMTVESDQLMTVLRTAVNLQFP
jgi:hypothetical protein